MEHAILQNDFQPAVGQRADSRAATFEPTLGSVPLSKEIRESVDTATAAHHLSRSKKTLLNWASGSAHAPIQPHRVNGRLHWPVKDLIRLLQASVAEGEGA